jgi:hypothetical protein
MSNKNITGQASFTLEGASLSATAKLRVNLSLTHLRAAAFLAGECYPLEQQYKWPATEPVLNQHNAFSISSVILSVASIEAFINEFHLDACDNSISFLGRASHVAHLIRDLWYTVERGPILEKYQWILILSGVEAFKKGSAPFQPAADLIELRDSLVHFKPEWDDDARINERLEARLAGKFELNILSMPSQLFIPYRSLGHGSGAWAVNSAREFIGAFCKKLECADRIDPYDEELANLLKGTAGH